MSFDKTVTLSNSPGTASDSGVGDSTFQGALIYTIDQHWAFGFGARLVDPTAQDSLGSDKWIRDTIFLPRNRA